MIWMKMNEFEEERRWQGSSSRRRKGEPMEWMAK